MMKKISNFDYLVSFDQEVSIGMCRYINQDETIMCRDTGFFAVSDGIGGFKHNGGGETSKLIKEEMPIRMGNLIKRWKDKVKTISSAKSRQEYAAEMLSEEIAQYSDFIFKVKNSKYKDIYGNYCYKYGATLSGVLLIENCVIYVNLGDSAGYLLRKGSENIIQVTTDHNVAAEMVQAGKLTKEEARYHRKSSKITRFMGMEAPARPEVFIEEVSEGDVILLSTDGLSSLVHEDVITTIMRSSEDPKEVCERLIREANAEGGLDNTAVVYIMIQDKKNTKY